ncbi:MAG: hypothetical protein A2Z45_00895 [Chloroflexi bacterium RBG_19FT_COMBO_55_16]|nr:MAG: hypothetical protein A2Z45_00895 [Chloroflexi bacterium RBG_19FT_COMBO_55_16]
MQKALRWGSRVSHTLVAEGLALLGGFVYLYQSWLYAHTQTSVLDEGSYLVKGFLFATGKYWPYQDYGPWSNHMPLAFLIPGFAQVLFGPGLRTGRYFAIILGGLMLLGLYLCVRRLSGKWWAAGAVLAIAMNPAEIKIFSMAISQVLIACMLVWMLALSLGEGRPLWQIVFGAVLAGALTLTRLNLFPVLPLFVGYVFWQHGRRAGLAASLTGSLVFLVGHAVFWPGIMHLWATWIPTGLAPFLERWRPPEAIPVWNPTVELRDRVLSFLWGIRFHFVAVVGVITTLLLWPKGEWRNKANYKASVFLVILFLLLFILHAYAALGVHSQTVDVMGKNYCVACFPLYVGFFSSSGVVLVAASASSWRWQVGGWRKIVIVVLILGLAGGLGYAAFSEIGEDLYRALGAPLLNLQVPRIRSLQLLPGNVALRVLLQNKFGLGHVGLTQLSLRAIPLLVGIATGLVILLLVWLIVRWLTRRQISIHASFSAICLVLFLTLGFLSSPTSLLGGGYHIYDCGGDVIDSYEAAGAHLSKVIPRGSQVYWLGGDSAVPLLYLKDASIFPPQINGIYTFRIGGDADALARYGFWNEALAREWAQQADFILIEEGLFGGWLGELVEAGDFNELMPSPLTVPCREKSSVHVFMKVK